MVPIATTTSFVQNGHWSSPDWISSVVLKDFLFIFRKSKTNFDTLVLQYYSIVVTSIVTDK